MKEQRQNELKSFEPEVIYVTRALPIIFVAVIMFTVGLFLGAEIDRIADGTKFILNTE